MSNPIEEADGIGRGSRSNAIEQARAYSEMLSARRREAQTGAGENPNEKHQANTSNNSTFTNSNDSLNANNVATNQVAGAGGAGALIHAGRESGQSSSDNQGHNSGRNHQDSIVRSIANSSRSELPTNVVSFFNDGPKPENAEARFSIHQRVAMANAMNRPSAANPEGQKLGGEAMNVIKNMDDADVQSGLEALRQATGKPPANNQMPNQGDSFTP